MTKAEQIRRDSEERIARWQAKLAEQIAGERRETQRKIAALSKGARGLSDEGIELIASFEGFVPHCYNDAAGHATIGYGHLLHEGPVTDADRRKWGTISRKRGLELLEQDVALAEKAVRRKVRRKLNQNQFDALVSFVFNVGEGAFADSTLLKLLNQNRKAKVPEQLMRWTKAGGQVVPGLVVRRQAEADLWRKPVKA